MPIPGSDTARMALQVPLRNPSRSVLTALGLAIGVGAFIAMVSFGQSARKSVVAQFEALGSNVLRVRTLFKSDRHAPKLLDHRDVIALRREATTVARVVPQATLSLPVTSTTGRHRARVRGTTPDFQVLEPDLELRAGGLFNDRDMRQAARVCVLGAGAARALFAGRDALGKTVSIDETLSCRVIGLLEARGVAISGHDLDDRVLLPLPTFERYFGLPNGLSRIELQPKRRELLEASKREVSAILRRTHHIGKDEEDDFAVESPDEVTQVARRIGTILTGLLAGIAGVSLLVGGIGIMNIQLVAVSERTNEIGIRAALGASPAQIMRQFLAEAVVLAGLGTAVGVALGVGASMGVAYALDWRQATSLEVVLGAAVFGLGVGTLFGYLPAKRAADLDPIEALRWE